MTTNKFFDNYTHSNEQKLVEDLVSEAIQIYGIDIFYLPRENQVDDDIFNESVFSSFSEYYEFEVYIENVQGFEGEGEMLQRFGLTIQDEVTLVVSPNRFSEETGMERPYEGDLIYLPLSNGLFSINFVEHEKQFYPRGTLPMYRMICELFTVGDEEIDIGISPVDSSTEETSPNYEENQNIEDEADENQSEDSNIFGNW